MQKGRIWPSCTAFINHVPDCCWKWDAGLDGPLCLLSKVLSLLSSLVMEREQGQEEQRSFILWVRKEKQWHHQTALTCCWSPVTLILNPCSSLSVCLAERWELRYRTPHLWRSHPPEGGMTVRQQHFQQKHFQIQGGTWCSAAAAASLFGCLLNLFLTWFLLGHPQPPGEWTAQSRD